MSTIVSLSDPQASRDAQDGNTEPITLNECKFCGLLYFVLKFSPFCSKECNVKCYGRNP